MKTGPIKAWWYQRAPRERLFLSAGTLLILLALLWALAWQPMTRHQAVLESRLSSRQQTLARLHEAQSLRAAQGGQPQAGQPLTSQDNLNESLPVAVDRGMRMGGLAASIRSIQPVGDQQVTITLEQAPFDLLSTWLEHASIHEGVDVAEASMERGSAKGTVNARLTLQRGSQANG